MLGIFGKKRKPETQAALDAEFQGLQDMAQIAESPEDFKTLAKSVTSLAVKAAKDEDEDDDTPAAGGKRVEGAVEDDDDYTGNDDDLDDDDTPDAAGSASPATGSRAQGVTDSAPPGRKMEKSLKTAMQEAGMPTEGLEAGAVLEAVSEALMESNKIAHATHETLQKSLRAQARLITHVETLEAKLEEERGFNKSVRAFIKDLERTPVGAPTGSAPYSPAQALSKGLSTPGGGEAFGGSVTQDTLRGLNESQLVKGLSQYLMSGKGAEFNLSAQDLNNIGVLPMDKLNPKIAEVAAQMLGVTLES